MNEYVILGGTAFAVVSEQDDNVLLITASSQGICKFGPTDDYRGSILQQRCEEWLESLSLPPDVLLERDVDLGKYGHITAKVAPLTKEEAIRYHYTLNDFWLISDDNTDNQLRCKYRPVILVPKSSIPQGEEYCITVALNQHCSFRFKAPDRSTAITAASEIFSDAVDNWNSDFSDSFYDYELCNDDGDVVVPFD